MPAFLIHFEVNQSTVSIWNLYFLVNENGALLYWSVLFIHDIITVERGPILRKYWP